MINWNDSMLVGVPQIDKQHQSLVKAINQLCEACTQGKGRSELEQTLDFVVNYTKDHFRDEEKFQVQNGYPGATTHKWMHTQFIMQVGTLVQEFKTVGPSVTLVGKMNQALVGWVINHIKTEDKKVGDFINKKSA